MRSRRTIRILAATAAVSMALTACAGDSDEENVDDGAGGEDAGGGDDGGAASAEGEFEPMTIRMGSTATHEHSYSRAAEAMIERVDERTGGAIEFDLAFSSVLGSERDMTEQVQRGELDVGWISDIGMSSVIPEIGFVTLPYLFPSYEEVDEHYFNGFLGEEVTSRLEERGIRRLGWLENDYRALTNSVRPVESVADLDGMSLRVPEMPMMEDLFDELGASPTPIAVPELLTALQQGTVDGQDNGIILTWSFGFHEAQEYYTDTRHIYSAGAVVAAEETWQSWPENVQQLLEEEFARAGEEAREMNRSDVEQFEQELVDAGLEFTSLDDEARDEFVAVGQSIWSDYEDEYGADLMTRIQDELGS